MIKQTEVDGIRALFAPAPGPLRAGLIFRVGFADESLPRRGITHLIEHLALHRHGMADHHANAATTATTTHFFTSGTPDEVAAYLTNVCDSLTNLPMERLAAEKSILRTEEASRGSGTMALWRYGATGYGTVSYPEWGLDALGPDDLHFWASTRFVKRNAVLWVAGDGLPYDLRLRLPEGTAHPMPQPTSALPVTPAYYAENTKNIAMNSVVRRGPKASVFAAMLERELYLHLRQQDGNSYAQSVTYSPRDADFAYITAAADALPEKQDAVLGGFIDVLASFRYGRIEQATLNAVRDKAMSSLDHPELYADLVVSDARDLLVGYRPLSVEQVRAEVAAMRLEDVHAVAVEAMNNALLQVPRHLRADWAGFAEAPLWSAVMAEGTDYPSLEQDGTKLVVGTSGVSLVTAEGAITVAYRECAALLRWPDGARRFIGLDGMVVEIEPNIYGVPNDLPQWLDAQVHPSVLIGMPARDPNRIPKPKASAAQSPAAAPAPARKAKPVRKRSLLNKILLGVSGLVLAFFLIGAVASTAEPATAVVDKVIIWIITAVIGMPFVLLLIFGKPRG